MNRITYHAIIVENFPVLLKYKFQTKTALLDMEADIIEMSHIWRKIFPMMVYLLGNSVGIPDGCDTINVSMRENSMGALVLDETIPPQFTPCSKHYAKKTFWFYK